MYNLYCANLVVSTGRLFEIFYKADSDFTLLELQLRRVKQDLNSLLQLAGFDTNRIEAGVTLVDMETDEDSLFEFYSLISELVDNFTAAAPAADMYVHYPIVVDSLIALKRLQYACGVAVS